MTPGCLTDSGRSRPSLLLSALTRRSQRRGLPVLVHVVSWRAWGLRLRGTPDRLAFSPALVWPSPSVHRVGVPIYDFRSSIPSPPMPLFTLRPAPRDTARKTRGQVGSLLLSCRTLSFLTTCRFIPALGRSRPSLVVRRKVMRLLSPFPPIGKPSYVQTLRLCLAGQISPRRPPYFQ